MPNPFEPEMTEQESKVQGAVKHRFPILYRKALTQWEREQGKWTGEGLHPDSVYEALTNLLEEA